MVRRLVRNSVSMLGGQATGKIFAFLISVIIARSFGAVEVGKLSYAATIGFFLSMWSEFGLSTVLVREIAIDKFDLGRMVGSSIFLKLLIFLVGIVSIFVLLLVQSDDITKTRLVLFFCVAVAFDTFIQMNNSLLSGSERFDLVALNSILIDAFRLLLVSFSVFFFKNIVYVGLAYFVASLVVLLIISFTNGREVVAKLEKPRRKDILRMLKLALPFMAYGLLLQVYFRIDMLLISWLQGDQETAFYFLSYRILEVLLFVPATIMGVLLPNFTQIFVREPLLINEKVEKTVRLMFNLGFIPVLFISMFAKSLVVYLYGQEYAYSGDILAILIWTLLLIFLNATFPMALNSSRNEKKNITVFIIASILNISGNLFAIPRWGAMGAAVVTIATELVNTILYVHFFEKTTGFPSRLRAFLLKASFVVGTVVIVMYVGRNFPVSLTFLAALLTFVGASFFFGTQEKRDYELIKRIMLAGNE